MQSRQWKATWTDEDGQLHTYTFVASDNQVIAEMDFQASRVDQGQPVPRFFTLEAGRRVVRVVPSFKELVERGQL